MLQARINIIEPNGVRRSMPLGLQGLVIGRDPGCEIPLAYERISRQHTEISFDGQQCYVTDLDSRNGTYLGKTRLTPNVPMPWSPDQALRVGDVYFNLEIPRSQQVRQQVVEQETLAGYVPAVPIRPKGNRRTLWFVLGGLALLCVCAGLAGLAFYLM
jgi:predicted component of type VI protein secretion system